MKIGTRFSSTALAALFSVLPSAFAEFEDSPLEHPPPQEMKSKPSAPKRGETDMEDLNRLREQANRGKMKIVYEGLDPDSHGERQIGSLQERMVIQTEFDYTNAAKHVKTDRVIYLSDEQKDWFSLTKPQSGVVLLARFVERARDKIRMDYLIVDTTREDLILSVPGIQTPVGEKTQISMDGAKEKITISLLAKYK